MNLLDEGSEEKKVMVYHSLTSASWEFVGALYKIVGKVKVSLGKHTAYHYWGI